MPRAHRARLGCGSQALYKMGITADYEQVKCQTEPLTALLAVGLPGGPVPMPQESRHGAFVLPSPVSRSIPAICQGLRTAWGLCQSLTLSF